MSERFPGGIISKTAPVPTGPYETGTAPGIWTLDQQAEFVKQGIWPIAGLTPNYIEDVFSTYLYTGNDSTQTITNNIDLAGEGGLVWLKGRTNARPHRLFDTTRGLNKYLNSASSDAEGTLSALTASSSGFSISSADSDINGINETYASWTFRKQPKFFDVVTATTVGSVVTFPHNLDSVPGFVMIKKTSGIENWYCYHTSLGVNQYFSINTTAPPDALSGSWTVSSTSVSFKYGSAGTYVAYLFASDAGGFGLSGEDNVISCGSFTTDGSGDATVTLGYEPQLVLMKYSSQSSDWMILDNMRGFRVTGNASPGNNGLFPNLSNAESTSNATISTYVDPTATGFIPIGFGPSKTIIYIAIRRGPMKVPESGTSVFETILRNGTSSVTTTGSLPPVDLSVTNCVSSDSSGRVWFDRLRGAVVLRTNNTAAEAANSNVLFDINQGIKLGSDGVGTTVNQSFSGPYSQNNFKRAPGFFDEVCYTGTGVARTVAHNLAAVPELMIIKSRSTGYGWTVYAAGVGNTSFAYLNEPDGFGVNSTAWNNTSPTSSVFTVGTGPIVNASGSTFVAYLFASCPGVSKVGSYTGTGTTQQINCGFTAGARFVLIKRTDSTGDWYVWDSARGIVAGNDPYLLLNTTAAEVTSTDYVDTYSAGFEITSTAPAAINASGGSFIFLAIA